MNFTCVIRSWFILNVELILSRLSNVRIFVSLLFVVKSHPVAVVGGLSLYTLANFVSLSETEKCLLVLERPLQVCRIKGNF